MRVLIRNHSSYRVVDTSGREPVIYYLFDPSAKRDGTNVASLPDQVHDRPALLLGTAQS